MKKLVKIVSTLAAASLFAADTFSLSTTSVSAEGAKPFVAPFCQVSRIQLPDGGGKQLTECKLD